MKNRKILITVSMIFLISLCSGCAINESAAQTMEQEADITVTRQESDNVDVGIPTGITANSTAYDQIRVVWDKVDGANGYEVYRTAQDDGEFELIATEQDSADQIMMSIIDRDIAMGVDYNYKVRAYITLGDENSYGEYSGIAVCHTKPPVVTGINAVGEADSITIRWDASDGVTGYEVTRSAARDGEYEVIADSDAATYVDNDTEKGFPYYYKIRAYVEIRHESIAATGEGKDMSKRIYGGDSQIVSAILEVNDEGKPVAINPDSTETSNVGTNDNARNDAAVGSGNSGNGSGNETGSGNSGGASGNADTAQPPAPSAAPAPELTPAPTQAQTPDPTPEPTSQPTQGPPARCNTCGQGLYDMDEIAAHGKEHALRGENFSYTTF